MPESFQAWGGGAPKGMTATAGLPVESSPETRSGKSVGQSINYGGLYYSGAPITAADTAKEDCGFTLFGPVSLLPLLPLPAVNAHHATFRPSLTDRAALSSSSHHSIRMYYCYRPNTCETPHSPATHARSLSSHPLLPRPWAGSNRLGPAYRQKVSKTADWLTVCRVRHPPST